MSDRFAHTGQFERIAGGGPAGIKPMATTTSQ